MVETQGRFNNGEVSFDGDCHDDNSNNCDGFCVNNNLYYLVLLKSVCLSVAVRKLQVVILARSSREISETVRIDCHSFLSRIRISVRPSTFL